MMRGQRKNGLREHPISEEFTQGYLEAAIATGTDEAGRPLDGDISRFSREALDRAIADTNDFLRANRRDLVATGVPHEQLGVDFWATRNHLSMGFFCYGEAGERLAAAALACGESHLYVGDDGQLHLR